MKTKRRIGANAPKAKDQLAFDLGAAAEEEANVPPSEDKLERAIKMGELMREADEKVQAAEAKLKEAKEAYNKIAMDELPMLLRELRLEEITLEGGAKIQVKKEVSAGISEARRLEALEWLQENGFGGLIKTAVAVEFEAGQNEKAEKLAEQIGKKFDGVTLKASVHASTLKSFIKEQLEAGTNIPLKLFGVHEYFVAKLTQPKAK